MAKKAFFSLLTVYPLDNTPDPSTMNAQVNVCVIDNTNAILTDTNSQLTQQYSIYGLAYTDTLATIRANFLSQVRSGYGDILIAAVWLDDVGVL